MKKIKINNVLLVFFILFLSIAVLLSAEVSVSIDNQYILPVAELASTKTNPDIISVENDLIRITLIPNRGRVIAEYELKSKEISFFHFDNKPEPMIQNDGLHAFEFGGYYLSVPWNTRDRQPFDLSFKITKRTSSLVEVYLSGRDMFKKTRTECWLKVRDHSAVVEIETTITNESSRQTVNFDLMDYAVLSIDERDRGAAMLLPVSAVDVIFARDEWVETENGTMFLNRNRLIWKDIDDRLSVEYAYPSALPCYAILYPKQKAALIHWWDSSTFFEMGSIESWGTSYEEYEGIDNYFVAMNRRPETSLGPDEAITFRSYFSGIEMKSRRPDLKNLYEDIIN